MLEQKLVEAKARRRKRFIYLAIGFITITLICGVVIYYISCCQIDHEEARIAFTDLNEETEKKVVATSTTQSQIMPDEQLRQSYIDALNDYENNIKSELNKIDLTRWDKPRSDRLAILQEEALSKFSIADYAGALISIEELTQLAQLMIADSRRQFEEALSNAQNAYDTDSYHDAKLHMDNAMMLNNQSDEAAILSGKIDSLPGIVPLLEEANTARVENNNEKELEVIQEIIKLVPERESAVERRRVLVDLIDKNNFKSNIAQSYKAIEQGNVGRAIQ